MHGGRAIVSKRSIIAALAVLFASNTYVTYAADKTPPDAATLAAIADVKACVNVGEPRKMVGLCGRAIRTGKLPDKYLIMAYSHRAYAYVTREQYRHALRDYGAVLRIDSRDADAYAGRAQVNNRMDNWRAAVEHYATAIQIRPDFTAAYYNRGLVYAQHKQYEKAVADFSKTLALAPKEVDALYNRAYAHYLLGRFDRAVRDFSGVLKRQPENINALKLRGESQFLSGKWQSAAADIRKTIERDGGDYVRFLLLYVSEKRTAGAAQKAEENLRRRNESVDLQTWYGLVTAFYLGQIREKALRNAIPERLSAAEQSESIPLIDYYIAEQRLNEGRLEEAERLFQKAENSAAKGTFEKIAAGQALKRLEARKQR